MSRKYSNFTSQYTVLKMLGEGGYGLVCLVRRISDGTLHAAKIIKDEVCRRKTWCEDRRYWIPDEIFHQESIDHPNIVKLEEIYYQESSWILVMEFIPGYKDLFDYILDTGPMCAEDARLVIVQILETVKYLSDRGIDHRDIKDENILYNPTSKHIKFIDFGSASHMPTGRYSTYQGTEAYLPPEFHKCRSYSALSATTWAVGCLAYSLLNGQPLFRTVQEVTEFKVLKFINLDLDELSKKFLVSMLTVDERKRVLPGGALFHPWIQRALRE